MSNLCPFIFCIFLDQTGTELRPRLSVLLPMWVSHCLLSLWLSHLIQSSLLLSFTCWCHLASEVKSITFIKLVPYVTFYGTYGIKVTFFSPALITNEFAWSRALNVSCRTTFAHDIGCFVYIVSNSRNVGMWDEPFMAAWVLSCCSLRDSLSEGLCALIPKFTSPWVFIPEGFGGWINLLHLL